MDIDNILGTTVGLLGVAVLANVFGKVIGKSLDDSLKVKETKSKDSFW